MCKVLSDASLSLHQNDKALKIEGELLLPGLTDDYRTMATDAAGNPTLNFEYAVQTRYTIQRMKGFQAQVVLGRVGSDLSEAAETDVKTFPAAFEYLNDTAMFATAIDVSKEAALTVNSEWAFAYRFSFDDGAHWTYCDTEGNEEFDSTFQGKLTIVAADETLCAGKCTAGKGDHCDYTSWNNDLDEYTKLSKQTGGCHVENGKPVCEVADVPEDCAVDPQYHCIDGFSHYTEGYCDSFSNACVTKDSESNCTGWNITSCSDDKSQVLSQSRICNPASGQCEASGESEVVVCGEDVCSYGTQYKGVAHSCACLGFHCSCQWTSHPCEKGAIISCEMLEAGKVEVTRYTGGCDEEEKYCATYNEELKPAIVCHADEKTYDLYKPVCTDETQSDGRKFSYTVTRDQSCDEGELCLNDACVKCERPEHCTEDATVTCEHEVSNSVCQKESGSACIEGWYGEACSTPCPNLNEDILCRDAEHTVCDQTTDETESCTACADGWSGSNCAQKCRFS